MRSSRKSHIRQLPSELRYDLVAQDWVVIATGRARRPESFQKEGRAKWRVPKRSCPFDNLNPKKETPTLAFLRGKKVELTKENPFPQNWTTISIPNKYPAFSSVGSLQTRLVGPYHVMDGVGFHEVIITKHHTNDLPQFTVPQIKELLDAYTSRYLDFMKESFVQYIFLFKNKGPSAGASVAHPHSQIIATPIIPADVQRSLRGSAEFFHENKKCVHCLMIEWDRKDGKRIVFENEYFIVVCPFASRVAFEMRIFPKQHLPRFETIDEVHKKSLGEAFAVTFRKLHKALRDPDYNYFLHTAPVGKGKGEYEHYHWHWEILPKTATWAGFELGTGIEISTIEPEAAAAFLRKQ